MSVVKGKCNRQNIFGVANETSGALASADFPETEGSIPRSRKSKLSIGTDHNIGNEVIVSTKRSVGITVLAIFVIQAPNND